MQYLLLGCDERAKHLLPPAAPRFARRTERRDYPIVEQRPDRRSCTPPTKPVSRSLRSGLNIGTRTLSTAVWKATSSPSFTQQGAASSIAFCAMSIQHGRNEDACDSIYDLYDALQTDGSRGPIL
eukprot:6204663-Pleurochrysis_carterae.AAC.2